MASSGSIWISLGLTTQNFQKGLRGARGQLKGFSGAMKGIGAGLKGLFNPTTIGIGALVGLGAALGDAFKKITQFQKAGSELKAVLGKQGTAGAMLLLSDQAKQLGASTAFTATEVRGLQKELVKLGFNPSEVQNMAGAVLDLAAATGTELSEAAAQTGAIINAFGLESSQATQVADVMALSFSSSALDMEKFSETMKNAAPIARATGVSLETATAAAGKLADANISGSKAGTDLRRIFSELVKDGKPFADSLEDIATEMGGATSQAEKLQIAEDLVGERAKGALLVLVDQKDALGDLATSFEEVDGEAREMADTMLNNVEGSLTKSASAYEGFVLSVEDGSGVISKATQGVIDGFTRVLQQLTDMNNTDFSFWARGSVEIDGQTVSIGKLNDQFTKNITKAKNVVDLQRLQAAAQKNLNGQLSKGILTQSGYDRANEKLAETTKNTKQAITDQMAANRPLLGTQKLLIKAYNRTTGNALKYNKAALGIVEAYNLQKKNIKPLTSAQLEAAAATRKMKNELANFTAIKLEVPKLTGAIDGIKKEIENTPAPTLSIPVTPELVVDSAESMTLENDTLELGRAAGAALSTSLVSAAQEGLVGLGEALGTGDVAAFGDALIGGFSNLLKSFGEQMIQLGLGMLALKAALALGPLGAGLAIAGGVALIAIASAIKGSMSEASATGFAEGGLVTGSVFGNVGEGRGTSKSNPELIMPVDKLKDFIGSTGGGFETVKFRVEGQDLVGVLKRVQKSDSFSR